MTPLVAFVQNTSNDLTPASLRLPPFLWSAFTALNKLHRTWRWYRRIEVYRQPDNLVQLLGGHMLNMVIGEAFVVRLAAQCLLVATRLLECAQEQASLGLAGKSWLDALKGHYPPPLKVAWSKHTKLTCLSPSLVYCCQLQLKASWQRVARLGTCSLHVGKHVLRLSMRIMDVIDAFCWSPETAQEGITEGFLNIAKWIKTITENKEELLLGLSTNQKLIERLLLGSSMTYPQLYAGVNQALENTEGIHQGIKKASAIGGGALVNAAKQGLNGSLVVMGLSRTLPVGDFGRHAFFQSV